MAPSHSELGMAVEVGKDEVVITGLSGRLPESDNIMEFRQHLIDNEDMVTENDRRWDVGELLLLLFHFSPPASPTNLTPGLHGLPAGNGKLKDLTRFDTSVFGVHPKQAHAMDPQLRMMLEVVYEAVLDAGEGPPHHLTARRDTRLYAWDQDRRLHWLQRVRES